MRNWTWFRVLAASLVVSGVVGIAPVALQSPASAGTTYSCPGGWSGPSGSTCWRYTLTGARKTISATRTYTAPVQTTPVQTAPVGSGSGSSTTVAAGTTILYTANASTYSTSCPAGTNYSSSSDVSQGAADALARGLANTYCNGATIASSFSVQGSYLDTCNGITYYATATATEPGGSGYYSAGNGGAGTAYTNAQAAAIAVADAKAQASAPPCSSTVVVGTGQYRSTKTRSGNGSSNNSYTVCSGSGSTTYTAPYTATSTRTATAYASTQSLANIDAAAAAVATAEAAANAAALAANTAAAQAAAVTCAALGTTTTQPVTTTTTQPVTTTTTPTPVTTGAIPNAAGSMFDAVACPTSVQCVAVGYNATFQSIWSVGTLSGAATTPSWSWSSPATIPSDASGRGLLSGIACPTSTTCIAVGGDGTGGGGPTGDGIYSIGTLSGGSWSWTSDSKTPSDSNGGGVLYAIQCVSTTECVAGGNDRNWHGVATSITDSNGQWTWGNETMVARTPSGDTGRILALSCPSATLCVGVGDNTANSGGAGSFTIGTKAGGQWTWSADQTIPGDGTGQGFLEGVACPSTTACFAVGYDNHLHGVKSVGTNVGGNWSWTTENLVSVNGVSAGEIAGITCSSAVSCSTVGYSQAASGATSGEANGVQFGTGLWSITGRLTIASPTTLPELLAIAATGAGQYVAVGYSNVAIVTG